MRYVLAALLLVGLMGIQQDSFARDGDGNTEAGLKRKCKSCKKQSVGKIRKKKGNKGRRGKMCYIGKQPCPQGCHKRVPRYCPKLEPMIKKVLGGNVKCWSNLFGVEGGCSATVKHDKVKAMNPHEGVGLCAIETSPKVRKNNRRGPACANISGLANQMKCCKSLVKNTNGRYFGTIICGNVPKCN